MKNRRGWRFFLLQVYSTSYLEKTLGESNLFILKNGSSEHSVEDTKLAAANINVCAGVKQVRFVYVHEACIFQAYSLARHLFGTFGDFPITSKSTMSGWIGGGRVFRSDFGRVHRRSIRSDPGRSPRGRGLSDPDFCYRSSNPMGIQLRSPNGKPTRTKTSDQKEGMAPYSGNWDFVGDTPWDWHTYIDPLKSTTPGLFSANMAVLRSVG